MSNNIFIYFKGRDRFGIVKPNDKYALEEKNITDLYSYKDHTTGNRIIFLAPGAGIKKDFPTERQIRKVDIAPTMSVLLGVKFPKHCEVAQLIRFYLKNFNIFYYENIKYKPIINHKELLC